jgi:hypothetical protein
LHTTVHNIICCETGGHCFCGSHHLPCFCLCSLFKHPNIIRLLGYTGVAVGQGADLCIVYEMGSRGSLGSNLRDDSKAKLLTWRDRVRVACGLACALNYLHCHQSGNPVYHRDVKSDNVGNPSHFLLFLGTMTPFLPCFPSSHIYHDGDRQCIDPTFAHLK